MARPLETYEQALEYLYGRINYERVHSADYTASDFKLNRMQTLLSLLGNPQERIPAVHVAGTKGKGSTAAMISAILSGAGYRVGLFTSPHISAFEERMSVGGVLPSPDQVVELVNALIEPVAILDQAPRKMGPTYFEITTAMSWLYFRQQGVQLAVLEVGLGGRLDATNVCRPAVCVITSISRDHMHLLGSELFQIAREKAGIVKPHVPVISGATHPEARAEIEDACRRNDAPLAQLGREIRYRYLPAADPGPTNEDAQDGSIDPDTPHARGAAMELEISDRRYPRLPITLIGEHQAHNTALAVAAIEKLRDAGWTISDSAIVEGLRGVRWPGRIEVVGEVPTVIVDTAHNWASMAALVETIRKSFSAPARVLVFAASKDKDVRGMLRQLVPEFDTLIVTRYLNNPRMVPPEQVLGMIRGLGDIPVHLAPDPASAWKLARRFAQRVDLICVTGSFFIAAEMRELILDECTTGTVTDAPLKSVPPD